MKRFARSGFEVWVGIIPRLGVVVYDPNSQEGVPDNRVRLYVRDEQRMATFAKDIVRDRLIESSGREEVEQLVEPAEFYCRLRARFTHCFRCKRNLNSFDFAFCSQCGWIRCSCTACGCNFHGVGEQFHSYRDKLTSRTHLSAIKSRLVKRAGDRASSSPRVIPAIPPGPVPTRLLDAIVLLVRSMPGQLTRTCLARILVGSHAQSAQRHRGHPLFGRFSWLTRKAVAAEVARQAVAGAIRIQGKWLYP